jgi:hypothetical protein
VCEKRLLFQHRENSCSRAFIDVSNVTLPFHRSFSRDSDLVARMPFGYSHLLFRWRCHCQQIRGIDSSKGRERPLKCLSACLFISSTFVVPSQLFAALPGAEKVVSVCVCVCFFRRFRLFHVSSRQRRQKQQTDEAKGMRRERRIRGREKSGIRVRLKKESRRRVKGNRNAEAKANTCVCERNVRHEHGIYAAVLLPSCFKLHCVR